MSIKENVLFSIRDDPTPKVMIGGKAYTIGARDYKGALCVMVKKTVYDWHRQDTRMTELKDVCTTAAARWGGGGNNMPYVLEPILLESNQNHATIQTDGISTALPASMGMGGGYTPMIEENAVVRRLTPMECERLQGYPDGWTDIGEWTDSKGKKHKDADSPRYKALGNSIALPFWEWMAKRIAAQYERPITMASLFDGIGGFPLVFSRAGATPVWASEIEEFPIAVTKIHFPEVEE